MGEGPDGASEGVLYRIPRIPYLRLRLVLRSLGRATLPPYKGSLLRGAFGHALREKVCAMGPSQACTSCPLRPACAYVEIFETFVAGDPPPFLGGLSDAPRPYVFEPHGDQQHFAAGDPLQLDLLLFGRAARLWGYALIAIERAAAAGLGAKRSPFTLSRAQCLTPEAIWQPLFQDGEHRQTGRIVASFPPVGWQPAAPHGEGAGDGACDIGTQGPATPRRASVRFVTPLRLPTRHRLRATVELRPIVFAMLRRTLELAHFHVDNPVVDWNFAPLLDHVGSLRIAACDLTWQDWERYSNRQQAKIRMGGLVGALELEGDLAPLVPLLRTVEIVHAGKGATLGLGQIALSCGGASAGAVASRQDEGPVSR